MKPQLPGSKEGFLKEEQSLEIGWGAELEGH